MKRFFLLIAEDGSVPCASERVRARRSSVRQGGFTLVELLVVIGIISLLVSILLPALNKARQAADTMACLSNMRQIGIANANYLVEYRNRMPSSYYAGIFWPNTAGFYTRYLVENPAAKQFEGPFMCPTYFKDGKRPIASSVAVTSVKVSYTYNAGAGVFNGLDWTTPSLFVTKVKRSADKAYLIDGIRRSATLTWYSASYAQVAGGLMNRHKGSLNNVLFMDGHAESLSAGAILYRGSDLPTGVLPAQDIWELPETKPVP